MFEIRVICDASDTDRIVTALDSTFTAGTVSVYPNNDGKRNRLYVTAEHSDDAEDVDAWPTPERAYAKAPSIVSEIGWTAHAAIGRPTYALLRREFWLRKAAVLDRIAHADESQGITGDASELATRAARRLVELDSTDATCDPRAYVRQQYAQWAKSQ